MAGEEGDITFETWPPRSGGQQAGVTSGVKATHVPSGIEAVVNIGRSQHRNKQIAEDMILSAITHPQYRLASSPSLSSRNMRPMPRASGRAICEP
jgi:protein subunit release factor A